MVSFSFGIASSLSYNCIISSSPFLKPIAWRLSASYKQQRLLPAPGAAKERRLNILSSNSSRSSTPLCTTTKAVSPLTAETAAIDDEGREGGGEEESWQAFCAQVGGEWDGYGAEFTTRGEPLELPSAVVPETFREWGVEIHDWQTQCPTLPQPAQKGKLWYKVIRLLPTVGCEADAATTFSVEECSTQEGGAAAAASALAYHKNGSYTAVWRGQPTILENPGPGPGKLVVREGEGLAVEQCLVVQDNNGRTRVRVLHELLPRWNSITVYRESWEGPFRNGESLGGCASSTSAFATQARLEASSLAGNWHVDQFATQTVTEAPAAVSEDVSLPYCLTICMHGLCYLSV
jgi:hypothetical protein